MFTGIKYVLDPTQTHFDEFKSDPKCALRSQGQNVFVPKKISSLTIIITSEDSEKIKTGNETVNNHLSIN